MKKSIKLWLGLSAPLFLTPIALAIPSSELYHVTAGDTLSQIAESKYGNWVKWHDLYSVNRDRINDPNLIYPGQRLRLLTDEEINFFKEKNGEFASSGSATPYRPRARKSNEWRLLPKQPWETFVFQTSPLIDPQGFDRRSKVPVRVANEVNAEATIASDRLAIYGEIVNARTDYSQIFLGDQVFVRPDEELQVGTTYSVTSGPQKLSSTRDGRVGFAYDVRGQVRIIGVRDGLFIGTVTKLFAPISRHELLIPLVKQYPLPKPIPAPAPINATILATDAAKNDMIGEQKIVFLDVGNDDGVKPGMIFRHYLHRDPNTKEEITTKDFLIESELLVLNTQDKFSTALVTHSRSTLRSNDEVVALTDLHDLNRNLGMQTFIQDHGTKGLDDLDLIDDTQGLGEKEDRELRQLEHWNHPAPEGTLQPVLDSDEIKREEVNPNAKSVDIGKEPAPNDGSNNPPPPPTASPSESGQVIKSSPNENPPPGPEPLPEQTPLPPAPDVPTEVPHDEVVPPAEDLSIPETTVEGSSEDPFAVPSGTPAP